MTRANFHPEVEEEGGPGTARFVSVVQERAVLTDNQPVTMSLFENVHR